MYPPLPTMEQVSADLTERAVRELMEIYLDDQGTLNAHAVRKLLESGPKS
jgi:hypothetical protein